MENFEKQFKEAISHKWVKVGLIVIAAVGILLIVRARLSNTQNSTVNPQTGLDDAQAADQMQLAAQSNQIQASLTAQNNAIAAQQAQQSEADQTALAGLTIQYQTQLEALKDTNATQLAENQSNNDTQVALSNVQLQAIESQYDNLTQQQKNQLNAEISLANISASENENIAATNAQVQINNSNNNVAIAHETSAAEIAASTNQAQVSEVASNNQLQAAISANQANVKIAQANNSGGGLCFITTAVCESRGLPDDCHELQVLRKFRDEHVSREWVSMYYFIAPKIVSRIDEFPKEKRELAYKLLYNYISVAINQIENKEYETARRTYVTLVLHAFSISRLKG